jgi:hypothetical protein
MRRNARLRYTLLTALGTLTAICIFCGWYFPSVIRQRSIVNQLKNEGVWESFSTGSDRDLSEEWQPDTFWSFDTLMTMALGEEYTPVRRLWLSGPTLSDHHVTVVANELRDLQVLLIQGEHVSDKSIEQLSNFKHLKALSLSRTGVTDEGIKVVKHHPNLQALTVAETKISDSSLEIISTLNKLTILDIANTNITEDGVELLSKKIPKSTIVIYYGSYSNPKYTIEEDR